MERVQGRAGQQAGENTLPGPHQLQPPTRASQETHRQATGQWRQDGVGVGMSSQAAFLQAGH